MPILLYCVGAIAFAIGAAAIGYGIPINEFSFGNTLIVAGAVAAIGGLVVLALGVVVSRLQQMTEALGRGAPMRLGQAEMPVPMRAAVQPAQGRMPFPPKPVVPPRPDAPAAEPVPSTEPKPPEPKAVDIKPEVPPAPLPRAFAMPPLPKRPLREPEQLAAASSPALPNPDEDTLGERVEEEPKPAPVDETLPSTVTASEEAKEVDQTDAETPEIEAVEAPEPAEREPRRFEPEPFRAPPPFRPSERFRPAAPAKSETGTFDAMWPAADKPAEPVAESAAEEASPEARPREETRAVAILKSGVVDGMGYTLYVDGSIEAELPQGTLRFASINELRAHLEKSS
jgi:hypothetical protein